MMAPPDPPPAKLIEPEPPPKTITAAPMPGRRRGTGGAETRAESVARNCGAAHRIRRRSRRREFGRRLARAVARPSQIEIERAADGAAADHRGEGTQQRARHAVAAGRRTVERCRGGGENLRRPDRKPSVPARPPCSTASGSPSRATIRPAAGKPAPRKRSAAQSGRRRGAAARSRKTPRLSSTVSRYQQAMQ